MAQVKWKVASPTGWKHNENGKIVRKHQDAVFFDADMDGEQILRSLIRDGYPSDIVILKAAKQ